MGDLYLDHNASTSVHPEVLETYLRAAREVPANPASLHRPGRRAQGVLEEARERIAALLGGSPREILFTSGATESNNLALLGAARGSRSLHGKACSLVASRAEHPAVLAPLRLLQQEGHPLHLVPIDPSGRVDAKRVVAAAGSEPAVAAVQWANNETGAVQPVAVLADRLPAATHLHVDAAQGFGKLPYDERLLGAATLAASGHKLRAPKGIGLLRVREDAFLDPVLAGGGQQRNLRPGTENAAGAVALAHALELAFSEQAAFAKDTSDACQALLSVLLPALPRMRCQSPGEEDSRLPNTLSLSFPGIDGRALLPACDLEGVFVSSGAACSTGAAQASPVLMACGLSEDDARASLRISFGWKQNQKTGREAGERLLRVLRRLYEHAKR